MDMITLDEKQKILNSLTTRLLKDMMMQTPALIPNIMVTQDIPVINLHIRYMDTQCMINLDVDTLARDIQSMNTLVAIIPDMNTMGKIPTMSTLWVKTRNMNTKEKRALIQAFIEEAKNITEADLEAGEHGTENPYENISSIIDQAHKIESAEDSKVDDDKSDNIPTVVEKEESSLMRFLLHEIFLIPKQKFSESLQVHTLNCQGPTGSRCSRGICTVACSDGAQVQMYCPSNSMVVKTRAVGELINQAEVSCGGGGEGKIDYGSVSNGFY